MSALQTTPTVALPATLDNALAAVNEPPDPAVPRSLAVGTVDPSQAHLLLANAGSLGVSIYAAMTDKGDICSFNTRGGGGCVSEFRNSVPVVWNGEVAPSGAWIFLMGLAPDRVRSVALQEDGATQKAILQNNAFYAEPTASPNAIVMTYEDGTTQTVAVSVPASEVQPPSG
jgi:hypothetical protein